MISPQARTYLGSSTLGMRGYLLKCSTGIYLRTSFTQTRIGMADVSDSHVNRYLYRKIREDLKIHFILLLGFATVMVIFVEFGPSRI